MKCAKCGKEVPIFICGQCEDCWNKPLVISDPAAIEKLH